MNMKLLLLFFIAMLGLAATDSRAAFVIQSPSATGSSIFSDSDTAKIIRAHKKQKSSYPFPRRRGRRSTPIIAALLAAGAIAFVLMAMTAAAPLYILYAALCLLGGFAMGIAALANNCPLRALAIFAVALFGVALLSYIIFGGGK